jgi:large subunit ribosomal protein L13
MDALSYKTSASKATVTKEWIVVDADGHNLGRLASSRYDFEVSTSQVTHHVDCGDNVIVINSEKSTLQVTKWTRRLTCVTQVTQEVKEL